MLLSCAGSTRASIAVLSQIEPTPGAVIAAHAVPEDCGRLAAVCQFFRQQLRRRQDRGLAGDGHVGADPGIPEWRQRLLHRHRGRAIRLVLGRPRHFVAGSGSRRTHLRRRIDGQGGGVDVELAPVQLEISDVGVVGVGRGGRSAAGPCGFSSAGTVCALACSTDAMLKPAASISSTVRPCRVLEIITPPACQ